MTHYMKLQNHPFFQFFWFVFFKNEEDFSIGWDKIEAVGKDTILVKIKECGRIHNEKQNLIQKNKLSMR